MKYRNGYVSNSSSASFILLNKYITEEQYEQFKEKAEEVGWNISQDEDVVKGWTVMDNGEFSDIIESLGLDYEKFYWDHN